MIYLCGSYALREYMDIGRQPADLDMACTHEGLKALISFVEDQGVKWRRVVPMSGDKYLLETVKGFKVEVEMIWPGSTIEQLLLIPDSLEDSHYALSVPEVFPEYPIYCGLLSLKALYWLKMTHRFKKDNPHFLKTMRDIQMIRESGQEDFKVCPWPEWFKRREEETLAHKHPNLNQPKKSFFSPDVQYTYDHDSIHVAIATPLYPAYLSFKEPGAEVKCSRKLFESLPYQVKLASVIEESMVLAIERSLVPFPGALTPVQAGLMALEKVCTSISSGWWREWAWEHYDEAAAALSTGLADEFYRNFLRGLENGTVKPHVA